MARKAAGPARMPAGKIPVDHWRGTIFWPLTLDLPPRGLDRNPRIRSTREGDLRPMHELIRDEIGKRLPVWDEIPDTLDHLPRPGVDQLDAQAAHDRAAYSEYTYFHDFIQRFQFSMHGEDPSREPFRLFRRSDIASLDLTLKDGQDGGNRLFRLAVDRLNLYVYSCGVAILAIELSAGGGKAISEITGLADDDGQGRTRGLMLADVLDLNDRLRRAHAPFLVPAASPVDVHAACTDTTPKLMPLRHAWRDAQGQELKAFVSDDDLMRSGDKAEPIRLRLRGMQKHEREIPPLNALRWLVERPAKGEPGWSIAPGMSKDISWRHVSDERLPILSTVTLADVQAYRDIDEGNWYRLAFVDGAGQDRLPYAGAFLRENWADHTYDRYHYPVPDRDDEPESTDGPVRFLMTGYSLLAVGHDDYFREQIVMHMRRHYFQIMLLAQFEMAAMLSFSSRVTLAISDYEEAGKSGSMTPATAAIIGLEGDLQQIEQDFLHFVHRYRFTGISGQIQPTEMFAKLRSAMRLDAVYADIKEELTTANDFLFRRADQRSSAAAERLNVIATIGVVVGLAMAFLSMQVLTGADFLDRMNIVSKTQGPYEHLALVLTVFGAFSGAGLGISHWLDDGQDGSRVTARLRSLLGWGAVVGLLAASVFWGVGRAQRPYAPDTQEVQICEIRNNKRWCPVSDFAPEAEAGARTPAVEAPAATVPDTPSTKP